MHHRGGIKPPRFDFPVPAGGGPDPNIDYGGIGSLNHKVRDL